MLFRTILKPVEVQHERSQVQQEHSDDDETPTVEETTRNARRLRRHAISRTTSLTSIADKPNPVKIDIRANPGEMEQALREHFQVSKHNLFNKK